MVLELLHANERTDRYEKLLIFSMQPKLSGWSMTMF